MQTEFKIQKIEITPIQILLNEPFVISKGPLTHARNTIVKIFIASGQYGLGECCPYRTIHGETQTGTVAAGKDLAELIIGMDVREIRSINKQINKSLAGNASIKCAFDMALYDLNAKILELPLYRYLNGNRKKQIYTDMTVSLLETQEMVKRAKKFVADGFPVLKIKLGERPAEKDIERITAIRDAIGLECPIRIDANQGWNYFEAIKVLEAVADLNIEHCEAPVAANNIIDRQRLVENSPIPIMGDESIFDHHDAYRNLALGAVDLINIKLGKSGGIENAMKIASIAEAAEVYCQVGSFSETRLGITALVHFSMAWDHILYHDLDSPLMHSEDPIVGGMVYHDDWEVSVNDAIGIGADIDPEFLKQFDTVSIS